MYAIIVLCSLVQFCIAQQSGTSELAHGGHNSANAKSQREPYIDRPMGNQKYVDSTYGTSNPQAAMVVQNSSRIGVGSYREIRLTGDQDSGKSYGNLRGAYNVNGANAASTWQNVGTVAPTIIIGSILMVTRLIS